MKVYENIIETIRKKLHFRQTRFDTNNSLPYGLCEKEGIHLKERATPTDAWNALKKKTGKGPEQYYAEVYNKGGSRQKVTHFRTKGGEMEVTYDLDIIRKTGRGKKKKNAVLLSGEKIRNIQSFAGAGSGSNFVNSGNYALRYPGTLAKEWSHKKGFADVIGVDGRIHPNTEIHWVEHPRIGQLDMKVKYPI